VYFNIYTLEHLKSGTQCLLTPPLFTTKERTLTCCI